MTNDKEPGWTKIRLTQAIDNIVQYGPTMNVGIAPVPFMGTGMASVLAQIDTGASTTCISPQLAAFLKVEPFDTSEAREAGREVISAKLFRVRLFFPCAEIDHEVAGLPSLGAPHDLLIGRDLLSRCRLTVDFLTGVTTIHIKEAP